MEGLRDNKPLLYSIMISGGAVLALAAGIFPDLSNMFEIVYFPPDVSVCSYNFIYTTFFLVIYFTTFYFNYIRIKA